MLQLFWESVLVIFAYASLWFFVSILKQRNDVADIAWGLGYILLCLWYLISTEVSARDIILYTLILVWGLRLSIHIYTRNKKKSEDDRYRQWRQEWGKWFYPRSYLQVYMLQGALLLFVISPVTIVSANAQPDLRILDVLGVLIWIIGFVFESVGDYQLKHFIQNPANKGKIMTHGLWKYTRHPNYFGEVTMWWGIWTIALSSPYGWFGVVGPLTITFLILFVSGIPMLEKKYQGNKDFELYKKRTSVFFPLPPKKA